MRRWILGVCLFGGLGCGDGGSGSPPASIPTSDIVGKLIDTHVTETGDVQNPLGASSYEIAAIVAMPDGATKEFAGIVSDDGTFRIEDVPDLPYDLRFLEFYGTGTLPPRYIMNAPRNVDLGRVYAGRPDAADATIDPTEIVLTATGLEPWGDGDDLELFSLGAGAAGSLVPTNLMFPEAGATSLTQYAVDTYALTSPKLVDGAAGDHATITQLVTYSDFTAAYRSVKKAFVMPSFTQQDGASTSVSGAFMDVPEKQIDIALDHEAFLAVAPQVHPLAEYAGKDVRIIAEPGGARATTSPTPTLLALKSGQKQQLPSPFVYGNPFGETYTEVISAGYVYSMTHTTTEGIPKQAAVLVGLSGSKDDFANTVAPVLSPALDIRVNGQPATDTLTGVGQTPTISWSAPSIGTPAVYIVALRRLDPGGATTKTMALFSTTATEMKMPAGLIDFGYSYYIRISVRSEFDLAVPFRSGTKSAFASAFTGVIVQ